MYGTSSSFAFTSLRVAFLSAGSRVVLVVLCILSGILIPDHQATGVAKFSGASWWLEPFTRWDSAHYLNIAMYGVQSEMELAFMPGYPWLIRKIEIIFSLFATATGWFNRSDCFVLAAISISLVSFVGSSLVLFRLLEHWKVPSRIKELALWVHLLNPANIFFTTAYTESLYSMLSWLGIL